MSSAATAKTAPIVTSEKTVACSGGGGVLGHPKTYYSLEETKQVTCSYCGQVFIRK